MLLKKVISGGQTGADIIGTAVAKACGVVTGGTMPKGFINLSGPQPQLAKEYNFKEHKSSKYSPRTYVNVRDSDGTLRIANNFESSGEKCTMKAILYYSKPYFDVKVLDAQLKSVMPDDLVPTIHEVKRWVLDRKIKVLNIAGNSEKSAPGISMFTYAFLTELFKILT